MITSSDIKKFRESRGLSLAEMGTMLSPAGAEPVSGSTIQRWEKGQDIPGPVQLLLGWIINGEVPAPVALGDSAEALKTAAWKVEMSLEAWERLEALRIAEGHPTMTDYIASLVMQELAAEGGEVPALRAADSSEVALLADQAGTEALPERKPVVYAKPVKKTRRP